MAPRNPGLDVLGCRLVATPAPAAAAGAAEAGAVATVRAPEIVLVAGWYFKIKVLPYWVVG
jgi:hypothetical protein